MTSIEKLFPSYEEALKECGLGYEVDALPLVVALKTKSIAPMLGGMLLDPDPLAVSFLALATARRDGEAVRVIDIGGACGYHYFAARAAFPDMPMRWHVVETPAMVRRAEEHFQIDDLRFHSSLESAVAALGGAADLIHASSVVQYVPNPESLIDSLVAVGVPKIVLARFPIYSGERVVGLQTSRLSDNGPGPLPAGIPDVTISYPVTFCNRDEIGDRLLSSYDIIGQFVSPSSNYLVGETSALGGSFILQRRG